MSEVTCILCAIEQGDPHAAAELLPLVYDELRKLAAQKLAQEKPGQTLQATALVHEAYLRLVDVEKVQHWDSRGHFFAAVAEAMRRILVENARRRRSEKHAGQLRRIDFEEAQSLAEPLADDLLALDEALDQLAAEDPVKAELVKLRCFAGLFPSGRRPGPGHLARHRRPLLGLRQVLALLQTLRAGPQRAGLIFPVSA
jgi:RNA polymerase sigma factor (TIGR02999 family)